MSIISKLEARSVDQLIANNETETRRNFYHNEEMRPVFATENNDVGDDKAKRWCCREYVCCESHWPVCRKMQMRIKKNVYSI